MKHAACYCRVSTEEQAKFGFSIAAQKDALEKYCKQNNYEYDFFIDEGISASSMKRPELQKMLNKIELHFYDIVLFTKLDRLSRNVLDANNINKILTKVNCTMKAIDEDDIDTSTADGTFMFNLKVSLAQREIEKTSERINFVFNNKREKNEVTSGSKSYGYDIVNKHYVVNEEEAQNVRNFYEYFISVAADTRKALEYFKVHFPTKSYEVYKKILTNTSYIGRYKLYRKDIFLEDYIPRIMTDELFFKVQDLLSKRRRITKNNKESPTSIFDGIIKCNECHSNMSRSIHYNKYGTYINYRCWKYLRFSKKENEIYQCNNRTCISESRIEKYLLDNLKELANNYIINNKALSAKTPIPKGNNMLPAIRKKLDKIKDLYMDDLIDKETYSIEYKKLKQLEKEELEKEEQNTAAQNFTQLEKIINSDFSTLYKSLSQTEKRRFWISIIESIYISTKIEKVNFI